MPNTIAKFARDYPSALTVKLVSAGGTGTPNASGYACTNTNGMQSFTVTETLVGLFYAYAYDAADEVAWQGYFDLLDDTATYFAMDDVPTLVWAKTAFSQSATNNTVLASYASPIATASSQATAAAASAASADSKATAIKAKTDLIGTIRSLIRW